jgi:hypothetical protein
LDIFGHFRTFFLLFALDLTHGGLASRLSQRQETPPHFDGICHPLSISHLKLPNSAPAGADCHLDIDFRAEDDAGKAADAAILLLHSSVHTNLCFQV